MRSGWENVTTGIHLFEDRKLNISAAVNAYLRAGIKKIFTIEKMLQSFENNGQTKSV